MTPTQSATAAVIGLIAFLAIGLACFMGWIAWPIFLVSGIIAGALGVYAYKRLYFKKQGEGLIHEWALCKEKLLGLHPCDKKTYAHILHYPTLCSQIDFVKKDKVLLSALDPDFLKQCDQVKYEALKDIKQLLSLESAKNKQELTRTLRAFLLTNREKQYCPLPCELEAVLRQNDIDVLKPLPTVPLGTVNSVSASSALLVREALKPVKLRCGRG